MQDNMMGQNIIITERCRSLRQLGRNALRGRWRNGIIAVIIYTLCLNVPQLIFDNLFGLNMANLFTSEGFTYNMDPEMYQQLYNSLPQASMLSLVWALLITGPLQLGLTIYFLASFRGHNVVAKDVFLGFERFGKALGLYLYQYLFIFLWTLLFIIPGIIAAIRYSQAFFVLADDPDKSITQCMNESKFMMKGNKGMYFLTGLSFIGWVILATVPGTILESIISTTTNGSAATIIGSLIASLFMAPVITYVYSTFAGFYEILAGHLIKETAPAPLSAEQIEADAPVARIKEVIEEVEADHKEQRPEALKAPEADSQAAEPQIETQTETDEQNALPEALEEEDKYND